MLPSLNLVLTESSTVFNTSRISKGKPIVMVYFGPDSKNCQEQTADIIKNIDSFKEIQFYIITTNPFERLQKFKKREEVNYKNLKLCNDNYFEYYNAMRPNTAPYIMIYDEHKKLKTTYEGAINENTIPNILHGLPK